MSKRDAALEAAQRLENYFIFDSDSYWPDGRALGVDDVHADLATVIEAVREGAA